MGYEAMGSVLHGLAQRKRTGSDYFTKAFQLREHASERERLVIMATTMSLVTGELDKVAQINQEWIESYPRDSDALNSLGTVFALQGQYQKAAEVMSKA